MLRLSDRSRLLLQFAVEGPRQRILATVAESQSPLREHSPARRDSLQVC